MGAIAEQAGSELHEGQTKPPGRYTEAALLGAMERAGEKLEEKELRRAMKGSGLGTPATRAAIIETLLRRGYIFREKKLLRPTERGQALIDALPVEALRSPQLTGRWEARLSAIAEGLETRMEFMRDIRSFTGAVVVDIRQAPAAQPIQGDESSRPQADPLGDCPACGTAVRPRGSVFTCDTGRECPFVVFAETSHAMISEEAVRRLLSTGSSDLIRGFKTRDAQPFDGVLRWNGQRVIPVRIDEREMAGAAGSCPDCGGDVTFRDGRWRCAGCPFTLAAKIMERPIRPTEATSLLENGRTSRLYGFRQKSGAFCKATLILDPEGQVRVDFSKPPGKGPRGLPAGGPLPAFDHPLDCPLCVQRGTLDPGYLVAGKSAWGCSAWKQGCPLQVPFVLSGREMKEEEVLRLLGKHRATKWLRGFKARDGLPRRESCRVLIQLDAECGWTLEEKPRASGR